MPGVELPTSKFQFGFNNLNPTKSIVVLSTFERGPVFNYFIEMANSRVDMYVCLSNLLSERLAHFIVNLAIYGK